MRTDSQDAILLMWTVEPANQVTGTATECASNTASTFYRHKALEQNKT
jgi:hypothetical protein